MPTTIAKKSRNRRGRVPRSGQRGRPAEASGRARSKQSAYALKRFAELRPFFANASQLARALQWDAATVAQWRAGKVVRPQRHKVEQVELLARMAEETHPYLSDKRAVGAWLTTALPNLQGATPAQWLLERGPRGLAELTATLVDSTPRIETRDLEPIDEKFAQQELGRAAEQDAGVSEFQRMLAHSTRTFGL